MALYEYRLVGPDGKSKKGRLEAPNADRVRSIVQEPGSYVTLVKEAGAMSREIDFKKVKAKDLAIFCEQTTSILKAGVPITEAIGMTSKTTQNSKLRKTLNLVLSRVVQGISLSSALGEYPDVFPFVMVQMVRAGEESGRQVEVFDRLAEQFKKQEATRNQIKKALAYPKMILIVVILAMCVVCGYVVPMFVDIFEDMGTAIPWSTKVFIALSDLITKRWWLLLIIAVVCFVSWSVFKRTDVGERFIDTFKRKAPLFKNLTVKTASADFARTLTTLLSSGMDYPRALEIAAETMSSLAYKDAVLQIHDDILNGATLTSAVVKTGMFPELLTSLMSIGEETGNIPKMLSNAADYFEDEVQTATLQLTSALNPVIIIFMGVFIGLLVYSIYSPMFSMYSGIS